MHCSDELHTTLRDGAGCFGFILSGDFVHDHSRRRHVLHCKPHAKMLISGRVNGLPARRADGHMRLVSRSCNLTSLVNDDHDVATLGAEFPRKIPQHSRLATVWRADDEYRVSTCHESWRQHPLHHSSDASADPDDYANEVVRSTSHPAYTVQCPWNAKAASRLQPPPRGKNGFIHEELHLQVSTAMVPAPFGLITAALWVEQIHTAQSATRLRKNHLGTLTLLEDDLIQFPQLTPEWQKTQLLWGWFRSLALVLTELLKQDLHK
mmetsp:Transcript_126861/g.370934  ORF Transcript_126861/g.370934 Transcript_126861/m.370934 type:complete len:265 (-) Transcript_126861:356-1150(-)